MDNSCLTQARATELATNAKFIAQRGKGILAADESTGTIKKRFDMIDVENTETNRAAYRDLLFTAKGLGDYISGAILYDETLFQKNSNGELMTDNLKKDNILIGIKVDKGVVPIPCSKGETSTQGHDDLATRCENYYKQGARFAKWRGVLTIDQAANKPSYLAIRETAISLAKYAAICQQNGLVPIVEPEILADGPHDIEHCAKITEHVLAETFAALHEHHVLLEGALLKPNMVTAGYQCAQKATAQDVAFYTVRTLKRTVPPALPGVMFLSGGQSEEEASVNLNAINKMGPHPWSLSFSYGRALQASTLKTWAGKPENVGKAQTELLNRAKANSQAQKGEYAGGSAGSSAADSLYEKKYVY